MYIHDKVKLDFHVSKTEVKMYKQVKAVLTVLFVSGCATLPEEPSSRSEQPIENLVKRGVFDLCETAPGGQDCLPGSNGISARGLGGIFLPLETLVPQISFSGARADANILVNEVAAQCSRGSVTGVSGQNAVRVGGIACNWIVIGNVIASITLELDWTEPSGTFGGRYTIQFSGTGNGAGSGHFRAESQRAQTK